MNNTRKIKCFGNGIETNEFFLHPITLTLTKNLNNKKICPTELYYKNGKAYYEKVADENTLSTMDIQRFMALPYLNLNLGQMLQIYKIMNVDDMVVWTNTMLEENKPYNYIKRIINIWILSNIDELRKNHKIIYTLIIKILKHYKLQITEDAEDKIEKWIKKKDLNDFDFDIFYNLL